MAEELSIDSLKEMKKADFFKAFKNKSEWKKASAVIVLVDYKLEGKKTTVAIPFRKEAEMKAEMKRIKKEKLHLIKKTGGGSISMENEGEDGMKAKIELKLGGLSPELLQGCGAELFDKIKTTLEVLIAADAELEIPDPADVNSEETEEKSDTVSTVSTTAATEKKAKRVARFSKIKENTVALEGLLLKGAGAQILEKINQYQDALKSMEAELLADTIVDAAEMKSIKDAHQKLDSLEKIVNEIPKAIELGNKIKAVLAKIQALKNN